MSGIDKKQDFKLWEKLVFFFPVQLLFVHLKKNLMLLLFWLLLFAIITKTVSLKYGIPYLFLQPEYLGRVDFVSHFIVGITLGSFIMAFNISSYVVNGFRFPFLATLNRPFIKYCQNNTIIPLAFSITYLYAMVIFQREYELMQPQTILFNVAGFVAGNLVFIAFTATYFIITNRNTSHYEQSDLQKKKPINPVRDLFSSKQKWQHLERKSKKEWRVVSYISKWGTIAIARDSSHYLPSTLEKVFAQNRINASLFQAAIIALLFVLGWFSDTDWLMIPAAGSILLSFTILIMLASAFYTWFRGWTSIVMVMLIIGVNYLSQKEPFQYKSQAYGMRYDTVRPIYNQATLRELQENDRYYKKDITEGLRYLENWKAKTGQQKPVAVFINVPGGGLRSAMWTMLSVDSANSATQGKLWQNTLLISGSSGGMLGAAYLREYYHRKTHDSLTLGIDEVLHDMAKDKLNTVAATAVMNDMFFRFKTFSYNNKSYTKDRAYAFERLLNKDTRGWLNKPLIAYQNVEHKAEMPMLLLAPTISDDGRKLLISAQGVSYLAHNTAADQINEGVEFRRFFEHQDADQLNFLSALRMSATFPYVFPAANLPSTPGVEILDAGIRDNYGISNTLKFMYTFRHWLAENTEKVVVIQVRDQEKFVDIATDKSRSLIESIMQPFGTFYKTVIDIQDYQMEDQLRLAYEWYSGEIEVIEFVLERSENNPISLSWRLTQKEQERILSSATSDQNLKSYLRLSDLMKDDN